MAQLTRAEVEGVVERDYGAWDTAIADTDFEDLAIELAKALLKMDDALEDAQTIIAWYEVGGFLGGRGVEAMTRRLARVEAAQLVREEQHES